MTGDERRQALNLDGNVKSQDLTSSADCVHVVTNNHAFLEPLPLTVADPEPGLFEVLEGWGIHTLGALTALRKEEVAHRLGPAGLELWERAAGESTRVLKLVSPPQIFVASMEFEHEVETLEPLLFILRRFVDRLAMELEAAYMAAVGLSLRLKMSDDTKHARAFRLPEPTVKSDILFRVLHTHLEQLRTEASITAVYLRVKPARPPVRQRGLFETELNDPHGFAETLARVVAVVGSGRVGTPYVQDTHRPDAAVMETPAAVVPPFAPSPVLPPLGLPLRRFRPPRPARVEMESGAPVSVWSDGVRGVIAVVRGPWRGRGDWWEAERVWKREEWDAELSGGGIYRLVRTPDGWFVEGEYD
jgi:protein ImuB